MDNKGMRFRFRIEPFAVAGTVGEGITLERVSRTMLIHSRAEFDEIIETLQRLRDEVCIVNSWEGEWNISFSGVPQAKEESDGVPVQDLAEK